MPDQAHIPDCPVTGLPAIRHVQWVTARLLTDLWRIEFKADSRPSFRGIDRFGFWEEHTGLYFFDPLVEADGAFYVDFYSRLGVSSNWPIRHEFLMAARHIKAGAR